MTRRDARPAAPRRPVGRLATRMMAATAVALAAAFSIVGPTAPAIAVTSERTLSLTRADGSPVGQLFDPVVMVPGDTVTTTVYAHRTGGGSSDLTVTLSGEGGSGAEPNAFERDAVVTVETQGIRRSATVADLISGREVIELGRSAVETLPIEVSLTLPFSSADDSKRQSLDLALVVTAIDADGSGGAPPGQGGPTGPPGASDVPALPHTGAAKTAGAVVLAGLLVVSGLVLVGTRRGRRRRDG